MRTKIIATIGGRSEQLPILKAMIAAGMDIARINGSHANPREIRRVSKKLRQVARTMHRGIDIMLDLQGPRLRVSNVPAVGRILRVGETVIFDTRSKARRGIIHIDDPYLHQDINVRDPLFMSNGEMEAIVTKVFDTSIHAKVVRGGRLLNRKGVNVPRTKLTTSGLTDKDIRDVHAGVAAGVDHIALSFVQSADDIHRLRRIVDRKVKIVAKIEMAVALRHLKGIIHASDAVMVARGDLGTEISPEDVPFVQKEIIALARKHRRPAIVATQMMISMVSAPRPTRAEVSDVANAVLDGAAMVMLSDETAAGKYPVESVAAMHRIIKRAEA